MRAFLQNRWLMLALRLVLGVIFLVASIAKLHDIDKFISTVAGYGILPDVLTHIYGYVVPWVELFIGCALILGVFIRLAAAFCIPLIISFMVASSYALANTTGGGCGCFGEFLTISHPVALIIDALMLFASFILLFNKVKEFFSIAQLIDRIWGRKKILSQIGRVASMVLLVVIVGLISISLNSRVEEIVEAVNIPASLTGDIDRSLNLKKPVLIEFYANGCEACEEAKPTIDDLEQVYSGKVVFLRIDYNQNPQAVSDMGVRTTPTVLVIVAKHSDGKYGVSCRFESGIRRETLQDCLDKSLLEVKD